MAILLVILGSMMIFFFTEAWTGVVLLVLGITIEVIGIALKHKD